MDRRLDLRSIRTGHLQAVGRDARGRKQYRYHPECRRRRDAEKHERVLLLARRLPRIREVVERDLRRQGMPREKVLALVVRLLELTHLRVGNREYERLNGSFGLTTMRDRHARVHGQPRALPLPRQGRQAPRGRRSATDASRGSSGASRSCAGQRLFEYEDDDGVRREIRSEDVNAYLREASGADVTAKDLRTWAGTVLAFRALRSPTRRPSASEMRRAVNVALGQVADRLGNTPAVTRASYVDPADHRGLAGGCGRSCPSGRERGRGPGRAADARGGGRRPAHPRAPGTRRASGREATSTRTAPGIRRAHASDVVVGRGRDR